MKIYRILGIGWAALCVFMLYPIYGLISYLLWLDENSISPALCMFFLFFALFVAGAVASYFLHRGLAWARILLCFIAVLSVLYCGAQEATHFRSDPAALQAVFISVGIFSLISVVVFLIPKRYVA